jgi:hypothetical protein
MNSIVNFLNIFFFIIYIILFKFKTNMKKFWLLTTLLIGWLLLTGCNNSVVENPEVIDSCTSGDSCTIDIDEPIEQTGNNFQIPAFEELNQAITLCHVDDMWWYDINVTKMAYILPYKDWYIGFDFDAQDVWNLYLTYRTLENPCDVLSTTDTIFWWNPAYKIWDATFRWASYPDNKIFYDQWLKSWIPTQIVAKELNCEPGKYGDGTFDTACTQEAMRYFYDLLIWAENDEYFTQWLKKFKEDIDNGNFRLWSYWRERHDSCLERVKAEIWDVKAWDSEEVRWNYIKLKTEKLHECAKEYLNQ